MRVQREQSTHQQVADYLKLQYPGVRFHTDFAAGIKLSVGMASRNKRLQSGRGWPDLLILGRGRNDRVGLALELKAEGTRLWLKDGTLTKDKHIQEQNEVLEEFRTLGFAAQFAAGFDEAQMIIDEYFGRA